MKIVHVLYSLEMGGAEMMVHQLCRIQRAQGHEVSVCAQEHVGAVGEMLRADGFEVQLADDAPPVVTMLHYFRLFRRMKPDVVHCHNRTATTHAALSARLARVPSVITTRHTLAAPYDDAEIRYSIMAGLCHKIVGVCDITCKNLREAPFSHARKIVRVYSGVAEVERTPFEQLDKRGFTLLFVGRLNADKDLQTMLRAMDIAAEKVLGLELWIVGDGPARGGLEALARELGIEGRVRFWGQRTDLAQFFSAADAFAMSSVSDGLSMALLEAMSLGVPAIVTDVGGIAEVVRCSGGGLLTPVKDAGRYADAIVRMAYDAPLREQLGGFARHSYEDEFTAEQMQAQYMEIYRRGRLPNRA